MIGKVLGLLAVPLAFVAYSSLAKASPSSFKAANRKGSFDFTGKSGMRWRFTPVSAFKQADGLLTIGDVWVPPSALGERRVLRFSQLGQAVGTRKYITSPFGGPNVKDNSVDAKLLRMAASDWGVALPPLLLERIRKAGG